MKLPKSSRRPRSVRMHPAVDQLELRTLMTTSSSLEETLNVQLRLGDTGAMTSLMPLMAASGATVASTTISGLYTVQGPAANMGQLAQDLSTNPAVEYAEPVQMFQILTAPNDADYVNGDQWQLNGTWGVNAPAAWNVTTGSDTVIVADVDTGLNYNLADIYDNVWLNQPEIPASVIGNLTDVENDGAITFTDLNNPVNQGAGKIEDTNGDGIITGADVLASTSVGGWVNSSAPDTQDGDTADPNDFIGWNFVNNTNNPMDDEGHGTFTAGEIGEMTNNTIGGAGLVWNTQIMPVAFLDSTGNGTDTAAAEAIDYAVNHGAKVINASWGGTGTDPTIEAAIQYADQNGVIIVAAAGNSGTDDDTTFFCSGVVLRRNIPTSSRSRPSAATAPWRPFPITASARFNSPLPGVNVYSTESERQLRHDERHVDGRAPGHGHSRPGGSRPSELDDEPGHRRGPRYRHSRPFAGGQGDHRRRRERGGRRCQHRRALRRLGHPRRLDQQQRRLVHRAVDLQRGDQPRDLSRPPRSLSPAPAASSPPPR